ASTGLGLYGLLGVFGVNATLQTPPPGRDPVEALLEWRPWQRGAVPFRRDAMVFGFGAVLGTVPDLAYAFSAKALLAATVPDLAVRASLEGRVLAERAKMADLGGPDGAGLRLLGLLAADSSAVTLALRGTYTVPRLLEVVVPFAA